MTMPAGERPDSLERLASAAERIAAVLEELGELARPHADTLAAYLRGGKVAAWNAARLARKGSDNGG